MRVATRIAHEYAKVLLTSRVQVSRWFNNHRNAVRRGREMYPGLNLANVTTENASEIKRKTSSVTMPITSLSRVSLSRLSFLDFIEDVEVKSEGHDPKISVRNEHSQEPSRDHPM